MFRSIVAQVEARFWHFSESSAQAERASLAGGCRLGRPCAHSVRWREENSVEQFALQATDVSVPGWK